ncbi:MAG: His/Gly/Thr/Pro-type tRNA ligase C-terminal domain-containing protein, partial [Gammaproteobacteria bacterium]
RPGVMFANLDLIGIPHRLVLSDRGLDAGTLEYKGRTDKNSEDILAKDILSFIQGKPLPSAL